jgi:hypothetical protein
LEVSEVPEVPEIGERPVVPEVVSEAVPEVPAPAPRVRRRGRTTLLIATAAVLGLVAGTCAGFLVQADREPTKLPSLSQSVVAQAKGDGPEPLSAAQDRKVKTDGDLRKLLVKRPKGSRAYSTGADGWMDVSAYAEEYTKPADIFSSRLEDGFRRAAVTGWSVGNAYTVEIRLVQYRQEETLAAADSVYDWKVDGTRSWAIPGTGDGLAYVDIRPDTKPGYLPMYQAQAHAYRGDIAMEIWIYDSKPIPKKTIMDLAKRQMGRL